MAKLRGGPAGGLHVEDDRDVIWVGWRPNCHGRPVPMTTEDGTAQTLPDGLPPGTKNLVNHVEGRWACYRRVGASTPEIETEPGEDLPIPSDGSTVYQWVCRRRQQ